jgi:hypothetical protein
MKLFPIFLFLLLITAEKKFSQELKNIKKHNLQKILNLSDLKTISEARDRQGIVEQEKLIDYSNCGNEFPQLPGSFPCSLMSNEFMNSNETISYGTTQGGKIFIKKYYNNKNNKVFYEISAEEEDHRIKITYKEDGYISYYIYLNNLVIFHWKGNLEKSLVEIFIIEIDEKDKVKNIKKWSFLNEK